MSFDVQLFTLLNSLSGHSPFWDGTIVFFASYLAYITVALFLGLLFFSAYSKAEKWHILLITLIPGIVARFGVTEAIRFFYHRPRPFLTLNFQPLFIDSAWSFPSGHATFFFAMATAIFLYHRKWGIVFYILAFVISVGRVAAGVHYPADILAGAGVGTLVACGIYSIGQKLAPKTSN